MRRQTGDKIWQSAALLLGVVILGCGEGADIGPVRGKVTLDGQPLPSAKVVFMPEEGRASLGETDDAGEYSLQYTAEQDGALVGKHQVQITTYQGVDPDLDIEEETPEKVPAKYNKETILEVEVPSGGDTFDFDLDSAGDVLQPGRQRSRSRTRTGC